MNKYIKKIINNKCYIFNVDNILGCRYKINKIFDAETKKNINNIDIYKINESYHDGYSFFTTYDIAFYHDFMELEQWKCFSNGYAGLYVHYDKHDVKKYEYYHINGKINDSYIDNKIKYTYIDGILYEKKVYYDKELKFIKRNIIYKNNIYEGTLYDRQGKCVEQYVNIEKNKHKSKIYKDDKLICECTYIIEYDEYTEYLKNDVYNIKYFIDNYKEYKNDKIQIECNLNNSGGKMCIKVY